MRVALGIPAIGRGTPSSRRAGIAARSSVGAYRTCGMSAAPLAGHLGGSERHWLSRLLPAPTAVVTGTWPTRSPASSDRHADSLLLASMERTLIQVSAPCCPRPRRSGLIPTFGGPPRLKCPTASWMCPSTFGPDQPSSRALPLSPISLHPNLPRICSWSKNGPCRVSSPGARKIR